MKQTLKLTFVLLLFVIPCAAQGNSQKSVLVPKAEKIIEVLYFCNTELSMGIAKFVKVLRKKPSAKAYVIVYANPKIAEYADALIRNTKWKFQERKIAENRIVIIEGGFREDTTAEFFIVPKGAAPPVPAPSSNEKDIASKL
jgi:hypothetical protein